MSLTVYGSKSSISNRIKYVHTNWIMCTQVKELEKLLNAIYMFMKVKVPEHVYSCALGDCRHEIFFPVSISLSQNFDFQQNFGTTYIRYHLRVWQCMFNWSRYYCIKISFVKWIINRWMFWIYVCNNVLSWFSRFTKSSPSKLCTWLLNWWTGSLPIKESPWTLSNWSESPVCLLLPSITNDLLPR